MPLQRWHAPGGGVGRAGADFFGKMPPGVVFPEATAEHSLCRGPHGEVCLARRPPPATCHSHPSLSLPDRPEPAAQFARKEQTLRPWHCCPLMAAVVTARGSGNNEGKGLPSVHLTPVGCPAPQLTPCLPSTCDLLNLLWTVNRRVGGQHPGLGPQPHPH